MRYLIEHSNDAGDICRGSLSKAQDPFDPSERCRECGRKVQVETMGPEWRIHNDRVRILR